MSYAMRSYTTSCAPVFPDVVSDDFDEIKDEALERLEWIKERAFGANDTAELEVHEDLDKYGEVEKEIGAADASSVSDDKPLIFGPMACGYNIEIERVEA